MDNLHTKRKLHSIQVLRGFAAMLVVLLHSIYSTNNSTCFFTLNNFFTIKLFGAVGVDIFFVISGFIISQVVKGKSGLKDTQVFLHRRFLRINPIYYLCSIPFLLFKIYTHHFLFVELLNTLLILPFCSINHTITTSPVFFVGWTLTYEWLFYLLMAFMICFYPKQKTVYTIFILLIAGICGLIFPPVHPQLKIITNPLLIEFVLGLLAGMIWSKTSSITLPYAITVFIAAILSFIALFILGEYIFANFINVSAINDVYHLLFVSIPCFLLVLGSLWLERLNRLQVVFNNRLLLLIGDASFSIYLIHWYCINTLFRITGHFLPALNTDIVSLLSIVFSIFTGILFYKYIEKRLLQKYNYQQRLPVQQ